MSPDDGVADVLVVGAGVAGCAVARDLAADRAVTVLDRAGTAAGATGVSAGLVAPTLFYGDEPALARYANAFFRAFDGTAGFSFTERPRLDFVDSSETAAAREEAERRAAEGFPVAYRDADAVAERFPWFDLSSFAGAVVYEDTGWVDPYGYATALQLDAENRGARFEREVAVLEVRVDDDAVVGVETSAGEYAANAVVVAAGWRTPELLPPGVDLPVRPYRTQCLVLEPADPLPEGFPLGRVSRDHLYFRPEHNGDLLVGGSPHLTDDPAGASRDADESFRLAVADAVPALVRGFERAGFVNGWAGVDAATPDARPVIDVPVGAPDGLLVATGFNGLGVMVSPAVGPTVRERLTGESAPFPTAPFAASRFDSADVGFALRSTSDV